MNDFDEYVLDSSFGSASDLAENLDDHDPACGLLKDEGGCTCPTPGAAA